MYIIIYYICINTYIILCKLLITQNYFPISKNTLKNLVYTKY